MFGKGRAWVSWSIITVNNLRAGKVSFQHCLCKYYLKALSKLNRSTHWRSLVEMCEEPEKKSLKEPDYCTTLTVDTEEVHAIVALRLCSCLHGIKGWNHKAKKNDFKKRFCRTNAKCLEIESPSVLLPERGILALLVWLCACRVICMLFWEHKQDPNYGLFRFPNPLYSKVNAFLSPEICRSFQCTRGSS